LTDERLHYRFEFEPMMKTQAQKVVNSFNLSLSLVENMLEQVQTLSLRIRIQLGIVSALRREIIFYTNADTI
jgi:hypothetical protein